MNSKFTTKQYSSKKMEKILSAQNVARRKSILGELAAIEAISPAARILMSLGGFINYYAQLVDLYPTQIDAYEAVEEAYLKITGKRKYSDFDSFRVLYGRYCNGETRCQQDRRIHK